MNKDMQQFKGVEMNGVSCGFSIRLRLNVAERLQIYLENRENYETFFYLVKAEDIKKQNARNHCDFIDTASEIFQFIEQEHRKGTPFQQLIKADSKGKITIKVEVEVTVQRTSKRKVVTYEFQTARQNQNGLQKLRAQFNAFTTDNSKFAQEMHKRIKELQQQSIRLNNQIRDLQKMPGSQPKHNHTEVQVIRFATDPSTLVVKNETILQTANKLNIVLFGGHLSPQLKFEWKLRVSHKMVLIFGIGSNKLIQLQNQALAEEIQSQRLIKRGYFLGEEIITCKFEDGELKYLIERVDIEEEQGSIPQPNYNMRRGSLVCKRFPKLDELFPCFGLHFGGRIEILSFKATK